MQAEISVGYARNHFLAYPKRNFRVTDQCKKILSYTRGFKMTLVFDIRVTFWHNDVSFLPHFPPNFRG